MSTDGMIQYAQKAKAMEGFIIDIGTSTEARLVARIDVSSIEWQKYREFLSALTAKLEEIDRAYKVRDIGDGKRFVKAKYVSITGKTVEFVPFPRKFCNELTNLRTYLYEVVNTMCLTLQQIGHRKLYFLPKGLAPELANIVHQINYGPIAGLRKEIEEYMSSEHFNGLVALLKSYGLDPSALSSQSFNIRNFYVLMLPVDFSYSAMKDDFYKKEEFKYALMEIEKVEKELETSLMAFKAEALKSLFEKVASLLEVLGTPRRKVKKAERLVDKLISMAESLGAEEFKEQVLVPLRKIVEFKGYDRYKAAVSVVGTSEYAKVLGEKVSKFAQGAVA